MAQWMALLGLTDEEMLTARLSPPWDGFLKTQNCLYWDTIKATNNLFQATSPDGKPLAKRDPLTNWHFIPLINPQENTSSRSVLQAEFPLESFKMILFAGEVSIHICLLNGTTCATSSHTSAHEYVYYIHMLHVCILIMLYIYIYICEA